MKKCSGINAREWEFDAILEVECTHCGRTVEFFKGEITRNCPRCKRTVRNARKDYGCGQWCSSRSEHKRNFCSKFKRSKDRFVGHKIPYRKMEGNLRLLGQPVSKYMGTGKLPWNPITLTDVQEAISEIKAVDPKIIALSPHDSSPDAIRAFEGVFKEAYRPVMAGDAVEI